MDYRKVLGLLIILIGLLALVHNVDIIPVNSSIFVAVIMILVGLIAFRVYFSQNRSLLLLLIAVLTFIWGAGILVYQLELLPAMLINDIFFLGMGIGFLAVYLHDMRQWWAVIPGGILFVLFVVDIMDELFNLQQGIPAFLILFGTGLTFFYLYLIRDKKNQLSWAIYPTIGFTLFALFILYVDSDRFSFQIFVAAALIIIGLTIVLRGIFADHSTVPAVPDTDQQETAEEKSLDENENSPDDTEKEQQNSGSE